MTKKNKYILSAFIVAIFVMALLTSEFLRGPRSIFAGFDRHYQREYEFITPGTTRDKTIAILGEPIKRSDSFCLPQKHGFEVYYDAAERSNAVEYLLWINGMNWYYCIGFDASGRAVVMGEGHS